MGTCVWCKEKIKETEAMERAKDLCRIPIGDPTFIEKQLLNGEICLNCFETSTNITGEYNLCLQCGGIVYWWIADNKPVIEKALAEGKMTQAKYEQFLCLDNDRKEAQLNRARKFKALKDSGVRPLTMHEEAFAEERLCEHCLYDSIRKAKEEARVYSPIKSYAPTLADYAESNYRDEKAAERRRA